VTARPCTSASRRPSRVWRRRPVAPATTGCGREPALVNDARLATAARRRLAAAGLPTAAFASCGSDDFATYAGQVPILMQFVGTAGPMLHHPRYLPGDDAVGLVAQVLLAGWLAAAELVLAGGPPSDVLGGT
jgi:metal-dependent amidase/aminoacylase/carboxypeptidase family protein